MDFRKLVLMNLASGQQWRYRHREETCGHKLERRGLDEMRLYHSNIYALPYIKLDR